MTVTRVPAAHPRPEGWWAYPPAYAVTVYLAAYVPNLPWWAYVIVGAALTVVGWFFARHLFHWIEVGPALADSAGYCAATTGVGTGAWLVAAQFYGPLQVWSWLAVGLAVLGSWWYLVSWMAPAAARHVGERDATPFAPATTSGVDVSLAVVYQGILSRAGSDDVDVLDVTLSPSGGVESARLTAAEGKEVTRAQFEGRLGKVSTALARHYAKHRGIDLQEEDVSVERGRNLSEFLLHVTVKRVMQASVLFVPPSTPQPWCGLKRYGRYADDQPLEVQTCSETEGGQHGEVVMTTGGGKTNLLNVLMSRRLESDQGEIWLIGCQKLVKAAWPWLEAWITGRTDRPVIDWVAGESPMACLRALVAAHAYVVLSNSTTPGNAARKPTRGKGGLQIYIDEASALLKDHPKERLRCIDGVSRNASEIVSEIQKLGRTAPASVIKLNQDALFDSLGSEGPRQRRNSRLGIAGAVMRAQDATSVIPALPGMNAEKLTDYQLYVQPGAGAEVRRMRAKFDHIPDEMITSLAERFTPWRYGLDPAITARIPYYAERWNPEWHRELLDLIAVLNASPDYPRSDLAWPVGRPSADTDPAPEPAPTPAATPEPVAVATKEPEVPQPDDLDARVAAAIPADWDSDGFDLWAALGADAGADVGASSTGAEAGGEAGGLDPASASLVSSTEKLAQFLASRRPESAGAVPDPLGLVLALLERPGAPTEWVPTEVLAVACGRVEAGDDALTRRRKVEEFGLELSRQTGLTTKPLPRPIDAQRRRGYRVDDLREAGRRLAG